MDPAEFGFSTLPLEHKPYSLISRDSLRGTNDGKVAIVTGAAGGIGSAIAEALANSGADVAILDLHADDLVKMQAACQQHGTKVKTYEFDVTDLARLKEILHDVEKELGPIE